MSAIAWIFVGAGCVVIWIAVTFIFIGFDEREKEEYDDMLLKRKITREEYKSKVIYKDEPGLYEWFWPIMVLYFPLKFLIVLFSFPFKKPLWKMKNIGYVLADFYYSLKG